VKPEKGGEFDEIGVRRESVAEMPVGSYVVDTSTGRSGVVMGHEGPYVQLRPHGGGREWDAVPEAVREATRRAVQTGMSPGQVAACVFRAIAAEQFYILTHPEAKAWVRTRMEDILEERNPTPERA